MTATTNIRKKTVSMDGKEHVLHNLWSAFMATEAQQAILKMKKEAEKIKNRKSK